MSFIFQFTAFRLNFVSLDARDKGALLISDYEASWFFDRVIGSRVSRASGGLHLI